MDVEKLKSDLKEYNQDHLLHFWDKLTDDEKQLLARDISSIDLKQVCKYFSDAVASLGEGAKKLDDLMKPLPDDVCGRFTDENENLLKDYEGEGLKAIWQGQVAVLLLAGGQGTRLGVKYPKGMYVVDIPSGKSLFQLQAERIRRLQTLATERYGASDGESDSDTHGIITWYIMTSAPTRKMTEDYFVQHSYFGLLPSQVKFFMQGTLPCFDFQGRIILEDRGRIARAPDGNGGVYAALQSSGQYEDMVARGVRHVHVYCVDNILVKVADPHFIGYCAARHAHAGAKVVSKRSWSEPVGVLCEVNGSYHVAKKKIPHISLETGELVKPDKPNGIKMEKFVFDVFPFTREMAVWEVRREDEFCPLKNADPAAGTAPGVDCPQQCTRSLSDLHARWLLAAGGKFTNSSSSGGDKATVGGDVICEISPLLSYAGEGLEAVVSGRTFTSPVVL